MYQYRTARLPGCKPIALGLRRVARHAVDGTGPGISFSPEVSPRGVGDPRRKRAAGRSLRPLIHGSAPPGVCLGCAGFAGGNSWTCVCVTSVISIAYVGFPAHGVLLVFLLGVGAESRLQAPTSLLRQRGGYVEDVWLQVAGAGVSGFILKSAGFAVRAARTCYTPPSVDVVPAWGDV